MAKGRILRTRLCMTGAAIVLLAACEEPFDFDLRDNANGFDTSRAVQNLPGRPSPDDRGIISYPNYQVVVARQDDTIRGIAIRLGLDANELAQYNGIEPDVILRRDEIIALPTRVAEPTVATGAANTGALDVSAVASGAIDRASAASPVTTTALAPVAPATGATPAAAPAPAAPAGAEPIRHQVVRGETVFAISRLYSVPVSAIADWNELDSEFTVREGQFLLIPQSGAPVPTQAVATPENVTLPGAGTATPVPPSAGTPLPDPVSAAPISPAAIPDAPDLGNQTTPASSGARFSFPVQGSIIRAYAPGSNEGIDIGVPAGTDVKAADGGTVAAVTNNTSGVAIVVVKHSDGLLTVYTNIDNLTVSKGDSVSRGQTIGKVRDGNPSFLHFEVRRGLQSVDPTDYLP